MLMVSVRSCIMNGTEGWPNGEGGGFEIRWAQARGGSNPSPSVERTMPVFGKEELHQLLREQVRRDASDLILKAGYVPVFKVHGEVQHVNLLGRALDPDDLVAWAKVMLPEDRRKALVENREVDYSYQLPGVGRFRVNAFFQKGYIAYVFRYIPQEIKSFEELHLPPVLAKISLIPRGLILVTGTTGSGKSTTLAAMIDYINRHRKVHIVTIEDPIEFLHVDKKATITQREVGRDTPSFFQGLKASLRQAPDVILVGEIRDRDTASLILTAAETGHLVMSTVHTTDAVETINRIVSMFEPHEQEYIRYQLSLTISAIISMRLIPRKDRKGRLPVVEVMLGTSTIKEYIKDPEKTHMIRDLIRDASVEGMQTFDDMLLKYLDQDLITYEDALRFATDPKALELRRQGFLETRESVEDMFGA